MCVSISDDTLDMDTYHKSCVKCTTNSLADPVLIPVLVTIGVITFSSLSPLSTRNSFKFTLYITR